MDMAESNTTSLNITRLLNEPLSVFLEEVKQDYLSNKYGKLLVDGNKILRTELENYLSRITNNFVYADRIYMDVYVWHTFLTFKYNLKFGDLPIIQTIYNILSEKIELKFYNDTFENLEKDSSYKNMVMEAVLNNTFEETEESMLLNRYRLKGYNKAVENFNSLKQDPKRTKIVTNNTKTQQKDLIKNKPKYIPSELLENYSFWYKHSKEFREETQGYCNIFKNITETQFFEMIDNADFSMIINKHGYSKRVRYNIYVLSRKLDKEWGERAANSINTTLDDCRKNSGFSEFGALKNMYLQ